jgi:hypothetical protein
MRRKEEKQSIEPTHEALFGSQRMIAAVAPRMADIIRAIGGALERAGWVEFDRLLVELEHQAFQADDPVVAATIRRTAEIIQGQTGPVLH